MYMIRRLSGQLHTACKLLAVALLLSTPGQLSSGGDGEGAAERNFVQITIDYDDGVQKRFTKLKWRSGLTVQGALQAASEHPRGIKFRHRGKDATAFLFQIDDLKNEASGRGWLFRVNGQRANRSMAVYPLKAGDTILWEFGKY